jgi:hypothetical protein
VTVYPEKPLPIYSGSKAILNLMDKYELRKQGQFIYRDEEKVFCLSKEAGSLPLLPGLKQSEMMLRWFFAPELQIRKAREDELTEICSLKEENIRRNFQFFTKSDLEEAVERSSSKEYMGREIREGNLFLGLENNQIKAIGAVKFLDPKTAFLYSGYSKGSRGGAAVAAYLIYLSRKQGAKRIISHVYKENSFGAKACQEFGFKREEKIIESTYVSGYPIYRWILDFS